MTTYNPGSNNLPEFDPANDYDPDPMKHLRFVRWWSYRFAPLAQEMFGSLDVFQSLMVGVCYASRFYNAGHGKSTKFCSYASLSMQMQLGRMYRNWCKFSVMPVATRFRPKNKHGRITLFSDLNDTGRAEIDAAEADVEPDPFRAGELEEWIKAFLPSALASLDKRSRECVERYYGIGRLKETLAVIAVDMGVTRERVRQIVVAGVARMGTVYRKRLRPGSEDNL